MFCKLSLNYSPFLLAAVLLLGLSAVSVVNAQTFDSPAELDGFVWAGTQNASDGSRQGLGWISLNCSNLGECGSSDYSVQVETDFTVTGYGWIGGNGSVPGGYVKFDGLSGCPGGGDCNARVVEKDNDQFELEGWARACAVFRNGCSGDLKSDVQLGGWDGWISLNCENTGECDTSNYGVRIAQAGNFDSSSYAWGADVVGLLSFSLTTLDHPCTYEATCFTNTDGYESRDVFCQLQDYQCSANTSCVQNGNRAACEAEDLTISSSLSCDSTLVRYGETVTCSWVTPPGATCEVRGRALSNVETSQLDVLENSGDETIGITNSSRYTLYCTPAGSDAPVDVDYVDIRALPRVFET